VEEAVHSPRLVRFATFEVDFPAGELRKSGVKLRLTGQPFQVLTILLERPGEVVTREELQKRLWPDTFVDVDHNLNTAINKIREVLGDSAESPRFVETPPRRGYRFVAPVEGAQTTVVSGGFGRDNEDQAIQSGSTTQAISPSQRAMPTGRNVVKMSGPSCHRSSFSHVACDLSLW
jgi:DNA-binding winged helix-turn-helix (wHTH) protein